MNTNITATSRWPSAAQIARARAIFSATQQRPDADNQMFLSE
ncbi:hypothetical protein [Spongiactinospora rosea]|nr:hypothetical protein [Spongiactinospora rosea]